MKLDQLVPLDLSPRASVFALLQRREYDEALAVACGLAPTHPERFALERVALARAQRFAEAAIAGRQHLATGKAETEDFYRLAQILLKCGAVEEAFAVGTSALEQTPEDWRLLVPVIEAVLALPALEVRLASWAAPIIACHPRRPPAPGEVSGGIISSARLPHNPVGGEHPIARKLIDCLAPLPIHRPASYGTGLVAAALNALPRARHAVEKLLASGIEVDRATAATYIAARFPCLLADDGSDDIEMLWHLPNSLGDRPHFIHFDFMPLLFFPFAAAEHMDFPRENPGIFRILKHQLEAPACLGIITHAQAAARQFLDIFDSPVIERKCTLINLPSDIVDRSVTGGPRLRARGQKDTVTLFFAASAAVMPEGFFTRGGVDVLNAFADLSEEFGNLRLILRGHLPPGLSARLHRLAREHPGIRWIADHLPQDAHEELLSESDIFVMPSIGVYRNGLIQALRFGLVPVIADCFYAENFIEPEITGMIARGRGHVTEITAGPGRFRTDWRQIFKAIDRPSDPVFFENFKAAIRRLVTDRDLLRRISAHNLALPTRHEMGEVDIGRFREIIQAGIRRARDMPWRQAIDGSV